MNELKIPEGGVDLKRRFRDDKDLVEVKSRIWFRNGRAWIFEVPSSEIEFSSNLLTCLILQHYIPNQDLLMLHGSSTTILQEGRACAEPYQGLSPPRPKVPNHFSGNGHGAPYPTMVIEAAKSQSLAVLHRKCLDYFLDRAVAGVVTVESTIRVAIKIYPRDNANFAIVILYYRNGAPANPVRIISCGTTHLDSVNAVPHVNAISPPGYSCEGVMSPLDPPPFVPVNPANPLNLQNPCNKLGIPLYQLQIPTAELFNGAVIPLDVVLPSICTVDLHSIQQTANNKLY
ncbi:hypothetical protein PPL_06975 [Heterostelium album PN500]|uniref:Uncharacterized protein n=1 Tax=Heterostelium pallidum (strain ATCC 26659 / Pp 5 / PN500) TaxID=670386 RepID=D3BE22_HETP5|nr:hypothetical protein PPL_06975 [Heterostelium album PN500]EFA80153.1 hypothetical protein PPL_06975 [Heterostelium album PN500]|eukprot:XP_020432273.1 hypothetical protein PPL_06975 [Heterostelium album PN500]